MDGEYAGGGGVYAYMSDIMRYTSDIMFLVISSRRTEGANRWWWLQ